MNDYTKKENYDYQSAVWDLNLQDIPSLTAADIKNITFTNTNISLGHGGSGGIYNDGILGTGTSGHWSSTSAIGTSGRWSSTSAIIAESISGLQDSGVRIRGNMHIDQENDIFIGNTGLASRLEKIESRLAIFTPNPELEREFDELRDLADQYRQLELEIKDRLKTFEILKKE
jgi:hypothetical protein